MMMMDKRLFLHEQAQRLVNFFVRFRVAGMCSKEKNKTFL